MEQEKLKDCYRRTNCYIHFKEPPNNIIKSEDGQKNQKNVYEDNYLNLKICKWMSYIVYVFVLIKIYKIHKKLKSKFRRGTMGGIQNRDN